MNEQEARRKLTDSPEISQLVDQLDLISIGSDDWVALERVLPQRGWVVKTKGPLIPFLASTALGQLVRKLGAPTSADERFLGSTQIGRYRMYDRGLGIWEAFDKIGDIAYPIAEWTDLSQRARCCKALVAFFDLRGFTNWSTSEKVEASKIQDVIEGLEEAFQEAFRGRLGTKLFAKGTGDGFMLVSEALWFDQNNPEVQARHVVQFCRGCADTVQRAKERVDQLAVGCGITTGEITQLYLLGRIDYIGPAVNEASKIQAVAYNELCIALNAVALLKEVEFPSWPIPGRGIRVDAGKFISATDLYS